MAPATDSGWCGLPVVGLSATGTVAADANDLRTARMSDAASTLLAIDGNSLFHRAYHAYAASNMTRKDGRPVFAVYGFMALFNGILEKTAADAVLVGFDDHEHNERKVRWPQYKAQREAKADDLYTQMDDVRALLTEIGVACVVSPGWEADDVIASAAHLAEQRGWKTVVATSDRDAFSLISDQTTVLRLVSGLDNAQELTPATLLDKYGVQPHQYTDYAALRGDKSDNLPGVMGIGEKTAAKLLAAMGTVEAALADQDATTAAIGSFAKRLFDGVDNWRLNVAVMTQRRDLPLDLDATLLNDIDVADLTRVLHAAELPNLVSRLASTMCGQALRSQRPGRARPIGDGAGQPTPPPPDEEPGAAPDRRGAPRPAAVARGVGRGMPAKEESTPVFTLGGRRYATTGGAARPERFPVTIR